MPKKKSAKMSSWRKLYKFALGGVIVMTVMAVGAMVWQYYDFQSKLWMYDDYEDALTTNPIEIDVIDAPNQIEGGLPVCGKSEDTKGGCLSVALSKPERFSSCQQLNTAVRPASETKQICRILAIQLKSWAQAYKTGECQEGLLLTQSFTSEYLVDKLSGAKTKKPYDLSGQHQCGGDTTKESYPYVYKDGKPVRILSAWKGEFKTSYIQSLRNQNYQVVWKKIPGVPKGSCKYQDEQSLDIVSGGTVYKYCSPVAQQPTLDGGVACYKGSPNHPTVQVCCVAGKSPIDGRCQ